MAERELLLSPQDDGNAVELSQRVYRKRILPKATINYRGRKIRFDEQYLNDLATSYKEGAYDQVAFMMAPDNNSHTLDPERFRGEIRDVEVADDGLYATFNVTPEAAKVLEENPKLGVSARILENYQRSDGKQFPRALQHVLGTLDPVIPGLGAWEEVALSNGVPEENVIDLSATSYEELEQMATRADYMKQVAEATDMTVEDLESLGMTDEELEVFASAFAEPDSASDAAVEDDELIEEDGQEPLFDADGSDDTADASENTEDTEEPAAEAEIPSDEDIEAAVEALSDEELEELAAELGINDSTTDEDPDETDESGETEDEAPAEQTEEAAEPTDAELVDRLANGEFTGGLGDTNEDPALDGFSDEALAQMLAEVEEQFSEQLAETSETVVDEAADDTDTTETEQATEDQNASELVGAGQVSLSNEADPSVVALSNQVGALQAQLAEQQFENLRKDYIRQGVPAALVDLARPVLTAGPAATLELSNGAGQTASVDAAAIVRQLLDSATGYIDLARERGHSYSPEKEDVAALAAAEDKRLASLWGEAYNR